MGNGAFMRLKTIFGISQLNLELRTKFLKGYVYSVMLYGYETQTIKDSTLFKQTT